MRNTITRIAIALWLLLAGCAANPVTGENQLVLLPQSMEIEMGRSQYAPGRQMHGGDYVLDPDLAAYVRAVGQRIAAASDRRLPYEFAVLNSSVPNAWALPGGKIAVTRGLLVKLNSEAELAAVLGHEIVHAAARHGARNVERRLLLQGALLAVAIATGGNDYSGLAVGAAGLGAELLNQRYSRGAELEADRYGIVYMVRAGYDPRAAVTLQETFVRLSRSKQPDWLGGLFASHPPSTERMRQNRATVAGLAPAGGEMGRQRYRRQTARLRRRQPAYEDFDKARRALKGGDTAKALSLVNAALEIEPRESRFHTLLGDILSSQGRRREALAAYNRAVRLDPGYFRNYYQRGRLWMKQGDMPQARQDLEKSLALLPTADGSYALGRLLIRQGERRRAVKLFRTAAKSHSPAGRAALRALHIYDLPDHPDRYLDTRLEENQGRFRVIISNPASVALTGLRVRVTRSRKHYFEFTINRVLKPGGRFTVQTDRRVNNKKELYKWHVSVQEAVPANPERILQDVEKEGHMAP